MINGFKPEEFKLSQITIDEYNAHCWRLGIDMMEKAFSDSSFNLILNQAPYRSLEEVFGNFDRKELPLVLVYFPEGTRTVGKAAKDLMRDKAGYLKECASGAESEGLTEVVLRTCQPGKNVRKYFDSFKIHMTGHNGNSIWTLRNFKIDAANLQFYAFSGVMPEMEGLRTIRGIYPNSV
ncbi:hypothetical protein J4212_04890 [Candidatus Woesearchaeota archaeon]|nr:hypothetical protein [Candidatus Woesearchaeota archaeon]